MIRVENIYRGFYNLPERSRLDMVMSGEILVTPPAVPSRKIRKSVKEWLAKITADPEQYLTQYFPIWLTKECGALNYGVEQGLILITRVMQHKDVSWWRVGVASPDDLDMDLDFEGADKIGLRTEVLAFMKTAMPRVGVTYDGLLTEIQLRFGGHRTS